MEGINISDILVIAIILIFAIWGMKKGFAKAAGKDRNDFPAF